MTVRDIPVASCQSHIRTAQPPLRLLCNVLTLEDIGPSHLRRKKKKLTRQGRWTHNVVPWLRQLGTWRRSLELVRDACFVYLCRTTPLSLNDKSPIFPTIRGVLVPGVLWGD